MAVNVMGARIMPFIFAVILSPAKILKVLKIFKNQLDKH